MVDGPPKTGSQKMGPIRRPDPRKIHVKGGADSLSAVAGLVLFGQFVQTIGLDRELGQAFRDMKDSARSTYSMEDVLRMLIDMFVAGEDRVFGLENLASDPVFRRMNGGKAPGLDVVYRDLRRFDEPRVDKLANIMVKQGLAEVEKLRGKPQAQLDIDTTVTVVFGEQEGACVGYNPKYPGRPSFHPLVARCAETRTWVGALLRPGNTSFGEAEGVFVGQCMDNMRSAIGPDTVLYVRIDSAGDCGAIMRTVHNRGSYFVTKAKMNTALRCKVNICQNWRTIEADDKGKPTLQVATIDFRRPGWGTVDDLPVRVVAMRTYDGSTNRSYDLWGNEDWSVEVFITNDPYVEEEDIAEKYNGRAGIEPMIAEAKNSWGMAAFSSDDFDANAAVFLLKLLAHNLVRRYVEARVPLVAGWRTDWIRKIIVRVPGKLAYHGRQYTVNIPSVHALQHLLN
jgi:hypothetical protein